MKAQKPQKEMCKSCPFRRDAPEDFRAVRSLLETRALTRTPVCHSTGEAADEFFGKKRIPARSCRGARDLQLKIMCALGFLPEATDEAWDKKAREMGLV